MLYISALQEGFLYGLLGIGIYISFKILDTPDLTAEGSFGLGSALSAIIAINGFPVFSIIIAFIGGVFAGMITSILQTKLNIHPVLAGIITMSALYSANLIIRNGPNLSIGKNTVFKMIYEEFSITANEKKHIYLAVSAIISLTVTAIIILFFKTHLGLCIRATGDNSEMVRASSINADNMLTVGLCLSNGLVAMSGGLISHFVGFSDTSMSNGILILGLTSVIIGEVIFGEKSVTIGIISAVIGSIIYKMIITFVIDFKLFGEYSANLTKLICAIIITATFLIPKTKRRRINA